MSQRRFPIALILLIALASVLSACGGGDGGSEDPKTVIDEATLQGIESGVIDLALAIDAKGKEGGDLDISLAGPFEEGAGGQEDLPELDLVAKADGSVNGERIDFDGGLVLLPSSAYVNYQGVDYEVDPTTYSFVESIIDPQSVEEAPQGPPTSLTACQETVGELKPADFTKKLKDGGEADVGGTSTTKVSGELDVASALDSLIELSKDPACKAQLSNAAALPSTSELEDARSEVKDTVRSAQIDVYVGDDDIVRRISAQLQLKPKKGTGKGPSSADVEFDLQLTGVNEDQEIAAPQGPKPLSDLFLELGINPLELLGLLEGEPDELLERFGGAGGSG
ncbi:MAG TPA: hypothetical protein VF729_01755 [Solirubrobacterales bacterium]